MKKQEPKWLTIPNIGVKNLNIKQGFNNRLTINKILSKICQHLTKN